MNPTRSGSSTGATNVITTSGSEDPHLLVAHYLELYGNATSTGDDTCPDGDDDGFLYYPGISNNYFDTVTPVSRCSMTITIKNIRL